MGNYKSNNKKATRIVFSVVALTFLSSMLILSALVFPSIPSNAKIAGAEVGVTAKEFIKLAVDTSSLALKDGSNNTVINPSPAGTMISGDVNLAVTTNTVKGYTLSAYTADSSTSMSNSNPSVTTNISSIATASGYNTSTGISDLAANTWGFKKSAKNDTATGNWFGVGANSGSGIVISSTDGDDADFCENLSYPLANTGCNSSTYDTYNIKFGAKLTSALPAGTYTNNVVFSAVAKSEGTKYTMNLNSNGGDSPNGSKILLEGSTTTLPSAGFNKAGYNLLGWALTSSATTTAYTVGQTVAVNDLISAAIAAGQSPATTNSFTIYAVWEVVTYMQNFDASTLALGDTIALTDRRDGSRYIVGKLPDGKVWMKQNLRLAKAMTLTPDDSDVSSNFNLAAPMATDSGWCSTSGCVDNSNTYYTEARSSYGAIYNWYTATAGTGTYSTTGNASSSICPKGWRLPIGTSSGDFVALDIALGGDGSNKANDPAMFTNYKNIAGFDLPGTINSTLILVGEYGRWWSATGPTANANAAIYMYIDLRNGTDTIYPFASNSKSFGGSVRCIAR